MSYQVTNADLYLTKQHVLNLRFKLEMYDKDDNYITTINCGLVSGNNNNTADSAIRRTASLSLIPDRKSRLYLDQNALIWIDKKAKIYIGIQNLRTKEYKYYKQGEFVLTSTSISFAATDNTMTLECSDYMSMLDGTKNGQLGALTTKIPAYLEDNTTGEVIKYYYIRDAIMQTIGQLGRFKEYQIDDVGEYLGMRQYNDNYLKYREESQTPVQDGSLMETWNAVPYDLEFSAGCSVLSILEELVNLYPNYEHYFNEDGVYCCNMIPSCDEDDITFYNDYMQSILISENTSVDLSTVRNMVMVWGQVIETDFYGNENVVLYDDTYTASIEGYEEEYYNGDTIALAIPSTNPVNAKININGFGAISIYDENTDEPLAENYLEANNTYAFKIKKKYVDGSNVVRAYYLGSWQVQSLSILTDGTTGNEYITTSGVTVSRYSKEYFQEVYNCPNVELTVCPDSPFTVQKLGEVLQVCTGGEYENIYSNSLALARSNYELFQHARMTDNITITTKIVPFADVNIKVQYQPKSFETDTEHQYVVKSISHDYMGGITSWTLVRFYELYEKL